MRIVTAVSLACILVLPLAGAGTMVHGGRYVAGADLVAVWCAAEPHPLTGPIGGPRSDPLWDWLLGGEPDCAWADALNTARELNGEERAEWGFSGFAWKLPPSVPGTAVAVWTDDDILGADGYLRVVGHADSGSDVVEEGCGPQVIVPPQDLEQHWQSTPDDVVHALWAWIPVAGFVDERMEACFASTGDVWASWEA